MVITVSDTLLGWAALSLNQGRGQVGYLQEGNREKKQCQFCLPSETLGFIPTLCARQSRHHYWTKPFIIAVFGLVFEPHPPMFKAYSWLCIQVLLLCQCSGDCMGCQGSNPGQLHVRQTPSLASSLSCLQRFHIQFCACWEFTILRYCLRAIKLDWKCPIRPTRVGVWPSTFVRRRL